MLEDMLGTELGAGKSEPILSTASRTEDRRPDGRSGRPAAESLAHLCTRHCLQGYELGLTFISLLVATEPATLVPIHTRPHASQGEADRRAVSRQAHGTRLEGAAAAQAVPRLG